MPTSAARANTISRWAPAAPRRCTIIWSRAASRRIACEPYRTARNGRSRCATTYRAGRRTGAPSPSSMPDPDHEHDPETWTAVFAKDHALEATNVGEGDNRRLTAPVVLWG